MDDRRLIDLRKRIGVRIGGLDEFMDTVEASHVSACGSVQ